MTISNFLRTPEGVQKCEQHGYTEDRRTDPGFCSVQEMGGRNGGEEWLGKITSDEKSRAK